MPVKYQGQSAPTKTTELVIEKDKTMNKTSDIRNRIFQITKKETRE